MKIAMILPSLHMGGGESFAIDLSNELAKDKNNQITLCIISKITDNMILKNRINKNIKLVSLNKERGFDYKILLKLRSFLKKNEYHIVHSHLRSLLYLSLSIISLKKIKFIHTFHTIIEQEASSLVYRSFFKYAFKYFSLTPVAITPEVSKGIKYTFGTEYKTMIKNGVSPISKSNKFQKIKKEIHTYKKNEDTKVFINIARLTEVKNQKLLIEVFKSIDLNVILLIVGSLNNEPTYSKECQSLISNTDNIFILGEKNNIGDYLYCSDALCLSSIYEGLPLVVLEAMSIGLPTLSTNVGGIPDVIKNGENGYLTQDMRAQSYINIINYFIQDTSIRKEDIYPIFTKQYSMKVCKNNYHNLYKEKLKEI